MKTAIAAEPVPTEPDSTLLSKRLQDKGISLPRMAVTMLGYKALSGYDTETHETTGESYLLTSTGDGAISVTTDKNGLQIAHTPFGLHGRFSFNAVDFLLAHDEHIPGPKEAAEAICYAAFKCLHSDVLAPVAPPVLVADPVAVVAPSPVSVTETHKVVVVPRELDITYAMSKTLHDQGVPLSRIASEMFGFQIEYPNVGGEYYIHNNGAFVAAVYPNKNDVEVAHYTDPVDGRTQVCAVRFAMQYGGYKSPLDANMALKQHFAKPAAPAA